MSLLDQFEMNDMGNATYVLVIRISRDRNLRLLYLDKEIYLKNLFKRFKTDKCKRLSIYFSKGQHLRNDNVSSR
jgi:hypothetical protein